MNKKNSTSPKAERLERERKLRRKAIIEIAREFFATKGYEQTFVEEIAKAAGYTKMTIYNYFDSKDDIFVAVLSLAYQKLFEIMNEYLKQKDVSHGLRSMGNAYLIFSERYPDDASLFDSGRISLVISKIVRKEEAGEAWTESEIEFMRDGRLLEELMTSVITQTMKDAGVQTKVEPSSVIIVLSTFAHTIRELIRRGTVTQEPLEKTREHLSVFFNIVDAGLKHYDD